MNKIKKLLFGENFPLLRELLSAMLHLVALVGMDVCFRVIYVKDNASPLPSKVPFLATLAACVILAGLAAVLPRLARRIYVIATTVFFAVLVAVHACMDSFFGQYLSFSSMMFAGDGAAFFDWSYFAIPKKLIALLVLAVALSVISALILPRPRRWLVRSAVAAGCAAVGILGTVLLSNTYYLGESGGITWDSQKSPADYYDEFSDFKLCVHMCGLYHYTARDFYISSGLRDRVALLSSGEMRKELDGYFSSKEADPDNEMTGALKGKNLLMIQLESIDTWMVNETAMPTLAGLRKESVNFTEFYAPKYLWASTFNTENVVNTGMISPMNSSKLGYFTETSYPDSAPALFQKAGYTVNSFHRSSRAIYNRGAVHENWGYTKYYTGAEMKLSNQDMDSALIEAYELYAPADTSFMSFIITYTGHGPYNADHPAVKKYESLIRPRLPEDAEDEYVWALCYARETDEFVRLLVERLKADGRLEDTVLAFYTDHYDHYITDDAILHKYKGTSNANELCNVPFFIYAEGLAPQTVEKPVATYDVLPTLINLFDLECDGSRLLGNDAFSENGGYIIFPDRSWYDGGAASSEELSARRREEIDRRLNACWDAIRIDYFRE